MTPPTPPVPVPWQPGEHGGEVWRAAAALGCAVDDLLDLSATLNPFAPDVASLARSHLAALAHYPDAGRATDALARRLAVEPERVVLTNGGAEAIALVVGSLGVARVDEPEFSLYRRHLRSVDAGAPRVRSNPHSPSGRLADPGDVAAVWDEAFWPLSTGTWTRGDADRGAWVVGSLTKLLRCPGLRIGYVLAPDARSAARVRAAQPAWSVGALACQLLPELLDHVDREGLATWTMRLAEARRDLVEVLVAAGLDVEVADAPWVLAHDPRRPDDASALRGALFAQRVLVRDLRTFGLPGRVRVAVPDAAGLVRLRDALASMPRDPSSRGRR